MLLAPVAVAWLSCGQSMQEVEPATSLYWWLGQLAQLVSPGEVEYLPEGQTKQVPASARDRVGDEG